MLRRSLLFALLGFAFGCGDGGPTTTETPRATVSVSVAPGPDVLGGPGETITLRETGGVGVRLSTIRVVRQLPGATNATVFDQNDIIQATGTSRVEPRGQMSVTVSALGGILEVNVEGTDDNGHQITAAWRR